MSFRCLVGLHQWWWFTLYDPSEHDASVKLSQCVCCRRIAGGWRGGKGAQP